MRSYEVELVIDGNPILSNNWGGAFDFDGNDPESVIITCGDEYSKIFHYVKTMLACASGACDERWEADDGSVIGDAVRSQKPRYARGEVKVSWVSLERAEPGSRAGSEAGEWRVLGGRVQGGKGEKNGSTWQG